MNLKSNINLKEMVQYFFSHQQELANSVFDGNALILISNIEKGLAIFKKVLKFSSFLIS